MKILIVGDPHGVLPTGIPKKVELILCTGDLGKADLARKIYLGRNEEDTGKADKDIALQKKIHSEIYNSSIKVAKRLPKIARAYSLLGNVGTQTDSDVNKEEKRLGIKLPHLRRELGKIRNFHLVRNQVRKIDGLKIGFLDYFTDEDWVKEFGEKIEKKLRASVKGTAKAKKILEGFGKIDILVCHQPPYGILDKVNSKFVPKSWIGKHAGSKVILGYIKKFQPRYVFCGHIHEGKGHAKIGKTEVYNVGCCGIFYYWTLINSPCECLEIFKNRAGK